ncbi:hypothetical protein A2392_02250 [Candidatus Kaiserbacteria bacterium RIFOXYB1_FULL_46_14]|uniref:Dipeptidylpeptidase IV N-terminal domain-containing protein n=1 Tax=Candidatus Kaiserbacteria bacterium RIFOXYB1_FULL_46_14 TaxID=1798531 RepID=A0A1F6FI89_9BACT|nr:MAG: hypothetical protein A2392_02250 [Candidatus Kaiserbacteria bacterium RIFOXYB1_FULL_46_14]
MPANNTMSKNILIIIGATTVILLIGAWGYLFLFGAPGSVTQVLNNLRSPDTPYEQPITGSTDTTVAIGNKNLAQLTTKSTAGFVLIKTASGSAVRYAEKGTGHIYEINLTSGTEERIGGTTFANTAEAYFSGDGSEIILVTIDGTDRKVVWRRSIDSAEPIALPANSYDFAWNDDGVLRYTVKESGVTVAYENRDGNPQELWRTPLSDVRVFFNQSETFLVNNPAPRLSGGLYEVKDNTLVREAGPEYAFTGMPDPTGQFLLYRYFDTENQTAVAKILDTYSNQETISALPAVPEKCAFSPAKQRVWCASSFMLLWRDREYLNKWYRGEVSSPDSLWVSNYNNFESASLVVDFSEEAGFDIDVVDMKVSDDGAMLLFRNKINDALWMYRLSEVSGEVEQEPTSEVVGATTTDAS